MSEVWVVTYTWDDYDSSRHDEFVGIGATAEVASQLAEDSAREMFAREKDPLGGCKVVPLGKPERGRRLMVGCHWWDVFPWEVKS